MAIPPWRCPISSHYFFKSQWYLAQYRLGPPEFMRGCRQFPECLQFPHLKNLNLLLLLFLKPSSSTRIFHCSMAEWMPTQSTSSLKDGSRTSCFLVGLFWGVLHLVPLIQGSIVETRSLTYWIFLFFYPTFPSSSLILWDQPSNKVCAPTFLS